MGEAMAERGGLEGPQARLRPSASGDCWLRAIDFGTNGVLAVESIPVRSEVLSQGQQQGSNWHR
jgi:hypothetical protein